MEAEMLTKPGACGPVSVQRKPFFVTHSKAIYVLVACLPLLKPPKVALVLLGLLPKAHISELCSLEIVPGLRPTHKKAFELESSVLFG